MLKACLLALVLGIVGASLSVDASRDFVRLQSGGRAARASPTPASCWCPACGCWCWCWRCSRWSTCRCSRLHTLPAEDEPSGGQGGVQKQQGQPGGQRPHQGAHARGPRRRMMARGAPGRSGGDEPDPLCGGTEVRPPTVPARPGGIGHRRSGHAFAANPGSSAGAGAAGAAAGARALRHHRA